MALIERLYQSATQAGFTVSCRWFPASGTKPKSHRVGFSAPNDTVLDGMALNTDYAITYPASVFAGLAVRDTVEIKRLRYQVRDARAIGDGSEIRARLARIWPDAR
jgi:hypothetical protein